MKTVTGPRGWLAQLRRQWLLHRLTDPAYAFVLEPPPPDEWVARVNADVQTLCPDAGAPVAARVITEKRATTAAVAHRRLPDLAWLHHQHIYPAGDYLHPRYPATLEAAVQTGQSAAALCLNEWALSKRTA